MWKMSCEYLALVHQGHYRHRACHTGVGATRYLNLDLTVYCMEPALNHPIGEEPHCGT
jgi:hypothetical protein